MESTDLIISEPREIRPLSAEEIKQRITLMQEVMRAVMKENTHYGMIPGTDKKSLYKAGAEVLNVTFRLAPHYAITRTDLGEGHREYEVRTTLVHVPSGQVWGEGMGSCSTMESKYRYHYAGRLCPACEVEAISKSRQEYGGGWYCNPRKGGCGTKFDADDPEILDQEVGKVENPDIADTYNTVLKISKKRSHVDATQSALACSDIFVQTTDDEDEEHESEPRRPRPAGSTSQTKGGAAAAKLITDKQIGFLMTVCKAFNVSEEDLKIYLTEKHNISSRKEIPAAKFDEILAWVKSHPQNSGGK